jgi:phosphomannomutase
MTTQTRQLFGTDGIRGVAGEFPLTQDSTYMIGRALGHDLKRSGGSARVVIGQDTRESSAWIADRVTHGLTSSGIEVHSAGVITTPGVAYLARSRKYAAGVVLSASHTPWTDTGIAGFPATAQIAGCTFGSYQGRKSSPAANPEALDSLSSRRVSRARASSGMPMSRGWPGVALI